MAEGTEQATSILKRHTLGMKALLVGVGGREGGRVHGWAYVWHFATQPGTLGHTGTKRAEVDVGL